ncbi:MAG TPA: S41 family peptidase [Chitinophaga sp.]
MKKNLLYAALAIALLPACHKKDHGTDAPPPTDTTGTLAERTQDTLYYIFKDEYLWTDAIPDYNTFKPRSAASLDLELNALMSYKRDSLDPTKPRDRYSFLDDGTVSEELDNGRAGDFGFNIGFYDYDDIRSTYVYPGSPAGLAGVKRGWKLTAVNGDTSLYYDYNENTGHGVNYDRLVNAFYFSSQTAFTFQQPDNSLVTVNLTTTTYNINPLLYSNIFNFGGHKIGYFVFNSFLSLDIVKPRLDSLFGAFASAGVTDVIVDIRYNGGGAVETSEYLANLLAPASVGNNTKLMYTEYFNSNLVNKQYNPYTKAMRIENGQYKLTDEYAYLVENNVAKWAKAGSFNPAHVVFIATDQTASASELLINNLKPVLPSWHQVGTHTYGKPVGFIGITIGGKDLYAISFSIKNSQNIGDYYYGLLPDGGTETYEDAREDFGDPQEIYLNQALKILGVPGNQIGGRLRATDFNPYQRPRVSRGFSSRSFKGMVMKLPHQRLRP